MIEEPDALNVVQPLHTVNVYWNITWYNHARFCMLSIKNNSNEPRSHGSREWPVL